MLAKCPTSLRLLSSINKLQQIQNPQCLKPVLHLCVGEIGARFAGHSKWQNIRHTKAAKDRAKSILFARIIKELERAAAKGSSDPKLNSELARVITMAEKSNVPAATVNRALTRIEFRKKNPIARILTYKGPRGIYLVLTAITDDFGRTKGDITKMCKKYNFVSFQGDPSAAFFAKGWIFAKVPENVTNIADKSLEDAIEVGAEDVEPDEERPGYLKFICECAELHKVKGKLEGRNYVIEEAYDMYQARAPIEVPESDMNTVNTLIENIEELPEVERVFVNII